MNLFNKFLSNRYYIGNKSPLNTLSMLDRERYNKHIENIATVVENEVNVYKYTFGIIKSTLEDINNRINDIKDISNYLPKIMRVDIIDWTEELRVSTFKPKLDNNIKLPDELSWVELAKEYRVKSENEHLVKLLLNIEIDELNSLYIKYIKNNLGAVFTNLISITKYDTLLKLLAIVDMFNTIEPIDNARGSLDNYKALFTTMYNNLVNSIKLLNKRIENGIDKHYIILDYDDKVIAVNPYEYNKLLDNGHSIELIYGAYLLNIDKLVTTDYIINIKDNAMKTFENFKTKISLRVTSQERLLLEEAYKQFFINLSKKYTPIISLSDFIKEIKKYKDELFNIEDMLIVIVQKYILPNSNIESFVKTIDKYTKQGISVDKARQMAIYRLIVDFLLKDVRKIEE